jgi:hypothetical protein
MGGISNRMKEIKRRRHRKQKVAKFALKLKKATQSERLVIATKLRKMTAGAEVLIARMGLDDRKRGCRLHEFDHCAVPFLDEAPGASGVDAGAAPGEPLRFWS